MMINPLVSITMPVYNGSKYLSNTIESILKQSYSNWELICVDDSSTDNSFEILNKYAKKDRRIRVFQKQNEKTSSKSVAYALKYVSGDYWMYSSQDDLISPDLLEKNVNTSVEKEADIVLPIMKWYYGANNIKDGYQGFKGNMNAEINNRDAFILSLDWQIHGFGLIKMSLLKKVGWYDYGYDSDEYTTRLLFLNANKIVFSDGIFYYGQNNPNAITKKFSLIHFDSLITFEKLDNILVKNSFSKQEKDKFRRLFFNKILFLLNQYFEYEQDIDDQHRKKIKKQLLNSFKSLKKSFLSNKEKLNPVNTNFYFLFYSVFFRRIIKSKFL